MGDRQVAMCNTFAHKFLDQIFQYNTHVCMHVHFQSNKSETCLKQIAEGKIFCPLQRGYVHET